MQSHEHFMQRAIELAARGTGCTSPNPLVGSVVVQDNKIIGEGWHEVYGQAHAEVNALNNALARTLQQASEGFVKTTHDTGKSALSGATLYVTLEPCNHHGYTPPCTQAIVNAGIKEVVYALADPNPRAAGGAAWLQSQGVNVVTGVLEEQARYINRFFLMHVANKRPYIIAKSATSLDGKVATRTGHSQWITGPEARQRGHQLRQAVDAIVVGSDTVIADNPSLTVRLPEHLCAAAAIRHPRPVILDSTGRVPLNLSLLDGSLPTSTIVITTDAMSSAHRKAIEANGHEVIVVNKNTTGVGTCPTATLDALGQRNIHSVLLEGGAMVHGTFRDAQLIDEFWTFLAPSVIGGQHAPSSFAGLGSDSLNEATVLCDVKLEHVGRDILIRARVAPAAQHNSEATSVATHTSNQTTNI